MKNYGWHFVGIALRDGRPIPARGVKLIHKGPVVPCESGLHLSRDPFDALRYAPGATLCLVKYGGTVVSHGDPEDKIACSERTILARMDFTEPLRYFARMQALSVVHLWDAPQEVIDYLMTGDESIRDAARNAAWAAQTARNAQTAWAAVWAACDAAWDARAAEDAEDAQTAWAAAWAACDAARNAVWAAQAAVWAACDAARNAAWDARAAEDGIRSAARKDFNALVEECFEGPLNFYCR